MIGSTISFAENKSKWHAVSFEKILLNNRGNEGVVFIKNTNGKSNVYSARYLLGNKPLRTRVISNDRYLELKKQFQNDIMAKSKSTNLNCENQITFINGSIVKATLIKTPIDNKITPICLSGSKNSRITADSFKLWYMDVRKIFDL